MHPPHQQQPTLATNSMTHHMGITGVTWPIDNDDSSLAPSCATRTAPCHVPPLPPLHATTISLTAGHCPLCAAAAATVYVQCHTAITMMPPHNTHPPPSRHLHPSHTLNHPPGHPLHSPTCCLPNTTYMPPTHCMYNVPPTEFHPTCHPLC